MTMSVFSGTRHLWAKYYTTYIITYGGIQIVEVGNCFNLFLLKTKLFPYFFENAI